MRCVDPRFDSRVPGGRRRVKFKAIAFPLAIGLGLSFLDKAQAATEAEAPSPYEQVPSTHGSLHVGVLAGFGFPRPLSIDGLLGIGDLVALGVEYSALPTTTIYGVDTRIEALAGDVRVFPFGGAFFVGARAGRQHLAASTTLELEALGSASGTVAVDTWFVNPRIGFLWMWQSGIAVGFDAGLQFPLTSDVTTTTSLGGSAIDGRVTSMSNTFGRRIVPTIDLLRIGFAF